MPKLTKDHQIRYSHEIGSNRISFSFLIEVVCTTSQVVQPTEMLIRYEKWNKYNQWAAIIAIITIYSVH